MELMFIRNNIIPERETRFRRLMMFVFVGCLPFWYNNPSASGQSSLSGIIICLDSHCGIIILPFWYIILPFWYHNDSQSTENELVVISPTYFRYKRTLKTRVRAQVTCKREKDERRRIARSGSGRLARVVGHRFSEAPILVL